MASIHKDKAGRSQFWYAAYSTYDNTEQRWKRHFKSTKTTSKKQAEQIARAWEKTGRIGKTGVLTPEAARDVIARGVADVFLAANTEDMPRATAGEWFDRWLMAKELESVASTVERYRGVAESFKASLGAKSKRDLAAITPADVQKFRDAEARIHSRNTVNLLLKVLRASFSAAEREGLITTNPAKRVPTIRATGNEVKRRPFTLSEIRRVLDAAKDSEFYGLVLAGIYTGQRLGDLARLTWQQVDLDKRIIRFVTRKTGQRLELPLAHPLHEHLLTLTSSDDPKSPIFPKAAALATERVNTLSRQFGELLAKAGLIETKTHEAKKNGRGALRDMSALSFHSLRHSAVSLLKAHGASDAFARAIVGHESDAVSQQYTHLDANDLRATVDAMPDVTKKEKVTK